MFQDFMCVVLVHKIHVHYAPGFACFCLQAKAFFFKPIENDILKHTVLIAYFSELGYFLPISVCCLFLQQKKLKGELFTRSAHID